MNRLAARTLQQPFFRRRLAWKGDHISGRNGRNILTPPLKPKRRLLGSATRVNQDDASSSSYVESRLGLGGHNWTLASQNQEHATQYASVVRSALVEGVTTLEAGPEGGDQALANALETIIDSQANLLTSQQPVSCLLRVGYRSVVPPLVTDTEDAEVHNLLFPNDVLVQEENGTETEKTNQTQRIFHNIGPAYLDYFIAESPLLTLQAQYPDLVKVNLLLHNPETHRVKQGDQQDNLADQLTESFLSLENKHMDRIDSYGVVSNGLCLPTHHPLHLSWTDHVLQAAQNAGPLSRFGILQLPINLLETTGAKVAQQAKQDAADKKLFQNPLQIYAMRPLTCYPDRGTGTGHPFVLADHWLPATLDEDQKLTSTHEMTAPPAVYTHALAAAMAHFDAEELLQAKMERKLTTEERETVDGCRLLQSMLHDLDQGLEKVRSFAAHEEQLMTQIIPLIHDTFESYDEDTAQTLQRFFGSYSMAVRYAIARNVRQLLTQGDNGSNAPTYPDLPPDMRLQEYAMRYVLGQDAFDKVIVGAEQPEQLRDIADIVRAFESEQT